MAERFNVSLAALKRINHLYSTQIRIGQILLIPKIK
ncbi:hypothetical protein B1F79_04965 [Coxiella-like endosymbiont of Rhipicephalus sanguineus]|nr:hypothetical protein [Coxiella-like endosymbiont of Rhipicephalus sanguineus]